MRLSARPLLNYNSANDYDYANQWTIRAGDPNILYFQLVDLDKIQNNVPLRYIAGVGGGNQPDSIVVTFPSIDATLQFTANATQDPNDGSIWSITLDGTKTPQSGSVRFQVTEGTNIRKFTVMAMIGVESPNDGCDGGIPDANTFTFNP